MFSTTLEGRIFMDVGIETVTVLICKISQVKEETTVNHPSIERICLIDNYYLGKGLMYEDDHHNSECHD